MTETPWGPIGYITYKRTYSRRLNENNLNSETEEFEDTVNRVIKACDVQLDCGFTDKDEEYIRSMMLNLKGLVAGRFLWQLGTRTVNRLGLPSLQNCAGVVVNEPIRPFTWTMDMLMLGSGVGYNIQKHHVYSLPKLKNKIKIIRQDDESADYIVPDTREGWVKLLGKVLKAHFYGGEGFTYSAQLIRSKGAVIKGFGGVSSGPEELCEGINLIHKILNARANKKLRPIDCLDIMNIIGWIVVSGNVRRSAQIALGDPDDIEFLKAKRWDLGNVPNWRAMSNNSVVAENIDELPEEFWETYKQGEPYGLINLRLSREVGRLGDTRYKDPDVEVYNPCAEQSLNNYETCCLAEIFLPNIKTKEELLKVAGYLYRICKHSLNLDCHNKETEEIVHRNQRMGIGLTGLMMASEEQLGWLDECYNFLRNLDDVYSEERGWPISIKLTTVKPSGTMSSLGGVTPGAHPNPAGPYFIRRIRIASNSILVGDLRDAGYPIEYALNFDGTEDKTTYVVSFPCKVPEGTLVAGQLKAVEHLEYTKRLQSIWSDNSVSCTIYYTYEELDEIKQWLKDNYYDGVKTVSFLLYTGHGFKQAPYETITKEEYEQLSSKINKITRVTIKESEIDLGQECSSGSCPVK